MYLLYYYLTTYLLYLNNFIFCNKQKTDKKRIKQIKNEKNRLKHVLNKQ